MKQRSVFGIVLILSPLLGSLSACESYSSPDDVSFQEQEQEVIDQMAPILRGEWALEKMNISFVDHWRQQEAGITTDTVFQDVGTLSITDCYNEAVPRYPDCYGTLTYQNLAIPIRFGLIASSERVVRGTGPHAFFLFEVDPTDIPDNYDWDQPEITFFRNVNLINENFALELLNTNEMEWTGLNASFRGLDSIKFTRNR